ncbi:hypothetical protein Syun_017552 [Stephania yunnanensis]|uniref:Uncharacterized protein n=1 Tax=Stephania yunnanensis TaxID=152371 RepID=A0AAP0P577_9MAGN
MARARSCLGQIPLAWARRRLGTSKLALGRFFWHEQGRALVDFFGMSKDAPWQVPLARARSCLGTSKAAAKHGQGRTLARQGTPWQGLTNLDFGVDQVKVCLVSFLDVSYWIWGNGLTFTIRGGVSSPRGGTGIVARRTLEHALGTMPRQDPRTYGPSHPEPCETTQGLEVLQIESDISIAHNDDDEAAIKIGVISERQEEPQIESKEDPSSVDSLVLEVPNELPILKEGVHAALPKYVDAPFVVDISKGDGITVARYFVSCLWLWMSTLWFPCRLETQEKLDTKGADEPIEVLLIPIGAKSTVVENVVAFLLHVHVSLHHSLVSYCSTYVASLLVYQLQPLASVPAIRHMACPDSSTHSSKSCLTCHLYDTCQMPIRQPLLLASAADASLYKCVHDVPDCSTCDPTLCERRPELALGARVGDSADLASTSRDQVSSQLDATTGVENSSLSRLCYRRIRGSRNRRALILGWAYYLDAFSSYLLRIWLPSVYRGHDN